MNLLFKFQATVICDKLLKILCCLRKKINSNWLECYQEDMKYDLTHVHCAKLKKNRAFKDFDESVELQL